jgi:hypothetical protein
MPAQTSVPDDAGYVTWYARWLAGWSYCFCRDAEIAIDALGIPANVGMPEVRLSVWQTNKTS